MGQVGGSGGIPRGGIFFFSSFFYFEKIIKRKRGNLLLGWRARRTLLLPGPQHGRKRGDQLVVCYLFARFVNPTGPN